MPAPKDQEARRLWIERNRAAHIGKGAKEKVPCPVDGCDRYVQAQGLCLLHYKRMKVNGSVEARKLLNSGKQCSVDRCDRGAVAKGMCNVHYQRLHRTGATECEFPRGEGLPGRPMSEDNKRKLAEANKGRVWTDEQKRAMSEAKKGCVGPWTGKKRGELSEEWKRAIGAANKGKSLSDVARGKISKSLTGRKHPQERVEKVRVAMLGKRPSQEALENIRAAAKKRTGPANNRWGKTPPHGKRIEYNGVIYRSSYEVRFVKALEQRGMMWEYEPKRFDLGTCTYLPDFYIPETGAYWEVKGWLGPDSQEKINRFREVHPEIPLVVATRPVIEAMERVAKVSSYYL